MKCSPWSLFFVFGWASRLSASNSWRSVSIGTRSLPLQQLHAASRHCLVNSPASQRNPVILLQAVASLWVRKRGEWGETDSWSTLSDFNWNVWSVILVSFFLGQSANLSCYVWQPVTWSILFEFKKIEIPLAHVLRNVNSCSHKGIFEMVALWSLEYCIFITLCLEREIARKALCLMYA